MWDKKKFKIFFLNFIIYNINSPYSHEFFLIFSYKILKFLIFLNWSKLTHKTWDFIL